MVTIKVRQNGSLLVEGEEVKLVDWNGAEYTVPKKPFALCRCGLSQQKPFCDAAHKNCAPSETQAAPGPRAEQPVVAPVTTPIA